MKGYAFSWIAVWCKIFGGFTLNLHEFTSRGLSLHDQQVGNTRKSSSRCNYTKMRARIGKWKGVISNKYLDEKERHDMPRFFVGAHQIDKCLDFRRSNVLLQQFAIVVQQSGDRVLCQNVVANLLLHKRELLCDPFLWNKNIQFQYTA